MPHQPDIPACIHWLPEHLKSQLHAIEPTNHYGELMYPCEALTRDGVIHPRVYVREAAARMQISGKWPWEDQTRIWLPIEQIASLRSSPDRLPVAFANGVLAAGESGMGYHAFSVDVQDGRRFYYVIGDAIDFIQWPRGVQPRDVVAVNPHDRAQEWRDVPPSQQFPAEYSVSYYRPSASTSRWRRLFGL